MAKTTSPADPALWAKGEAAATEFAERQAAARAQLQRETGVGGNRGAAAANEGHATGRAAAAPALKTPDPAEWAKSRAPAEDFARAQAAAREQLQRETGAGGNRTPAGANDGRYARTAEEAQATRQTRQGHAAARINGAPTSDHIPSNTPAEAEARRIASQRTAAAAAQDEMKRNPVPAPKPSAPAAAATEAAGAGTKAIVKTGEEVAEKAVVEVAKKGLWAGLKRLGGPIINGAIDMYSDVVDGVKTGDPMRVVRGVVKGAVAVGIGVGAAAIGVATAPAWVVGVGATVVGIGATYVVDKAFDAMTSKTLTDRSGKPIQGGGTNMHGGRGAPVQAKTPPAPAVAPPAAAPKTPEQEAEDIVAQRMNARREAAAAAEAAKGGAKTVSVAPTRAVAQPSGHGREAAPSHQTARGAPPAAHPRMEQPIQHGPDAVHAQLQADILMRKKEIDAGHNVAHNQAVIAKEQALMKKGSVSVAEIRAAFMGSDEISGGTTVSQNTAPKAVAVAVDSTRTRET